MKWLDLVRIPAVRLRSPKNSQMEYTKGIKHVVIIPDAEKCLKCLLTPVEVFPLHLNDGNTIFDLCNLLLAHSTGNHP